MDVNNLLNSVQAKVATMTAPKNQGITAFAGTTKPEGGCQGCKSCGACGKKAHEGKALDVRG